VCWVHCVCDCVHSFICACVTVCFGEFNALIFPCFSVFPTTRRHGLKPMHEFSCKDLWVEYDCSDHHNRKKNQEECFYFVIHSGGNHIEFKVKNEVVDVYSIHTYTHKCTEANLHFCVLYIHSEICRSFIIVYLSARARV